MTGSIIAKPGAYPDISIEDYHRNARLLPGPSLSSSGAKAILNKSAYHFWADSPMNPDRPAEEEKPHFNIGKAAHDMMAFGEEWRNRYHILPEGYRAASSRTKNFNEDQIAHGKAIEDGLHVLKHDDAKVVAQVAEHIGMNEIAAKALSNGHSEMTIVWKDPEFDVWLRCRPDFLPNTVINGGDIRAVTDLKFMAPTHCKPKGFQKAISDFGYHMSAALYADGIKAVYGREPTHWLHIVVEKEFPFTVSLYELPQADIERGRHQIRMAIRTFAECLDSGRWPAYADEPVAVGLPPWARKTIDEYGSDTDAALLNAA